MALGDEWYIFGIRILPNHTWIRSNLHIIQDPITIFLLHKSGLAREGLAGVLGGLPGCRVVKATKDVGELKRTVAGPGAPTVLVVHVDLALAGQARLLRWCGQHMAATPVLVLGPPPTADVLVQLVRLGAQAFCGENQDSTYLHRMLQQLAEGTIQFPVALLHELRTVMPAPRTLARPGRPLSPRLRQFMALLARNDDLTYKGIAQRMNVSIHTVYKYRRTICQRFAVRTRRALITLALDMGL